MLDIAVYDANPKIAKYWYHDFLELHESKTDEYNTRTAFKSIKSVLDNNVKNSFLKITVLFNATISYFRSHENFHSKIF